MALGFQISINSSKMQQWAIIKLDLPNKGTILPKYIDDNYARFKQNGCALSIAMK